MKKIAIGLSVFVVLAIGALLIGPGLIDWNQYTAQITRQVEKITGRKVEIGGDVSVRILPSPRLTVADVHLANISGSNDARMASLDSLEVKVAFVPLLTGNIRVETIMLVRPRILLERLADGRVNWDFGAPAQSSEAGNGAPATAGAATDTGSGASGGSPGGGPGLAVDNFTVQDGTLVYRDLQRGREETIGDINARIAAASLQGPVESDGSLIFGGRRLGYSLNVAEIVQGRTVPLVFNLDLGHGTIVKVDGGVVNVPEKPRLRAKVTASGADLGGTIRDLSGGDPLPVNLVRAFSAAGEIEAGADGGHIEDLTVSMDAMDLKVAARVTTGDVIVAGLTVTAGKVDLDALMSPVPVAAATKNTATGGPITAAKDADASKPKEKAVATAASGTSEFALPKDIQATVAVRADEVLFKGKPLKGVSLSADLANGELTLNQVTAQLPGDADVGLFGFLSSRGGKPRFEGQIETRAADLEPVLEWLAPGVDVPSAALKGFRFKTPLAIDGNYAQLTGIDAAAGGSHLTGAVTFALQARPSFGANLNLDKIDLDALMPASGSAAAKTTGGSSAKASTGATGGAATGTATSAAAGVDLFAPLKPLTTFDANVKLAVGGAVMRGLKASDIAVDATLQRGELTVRKLNVGSLAGLRAGVTGGLSGLDGIPTAKGLRVTAAAKDMGPLAKAFDLPLPLPASAIGAVSLDARIDGSLLNPKVSADLGALGGDAALQGSLPVLALAGSDLRLGVAAKHPDLAGLLRRLDVDYQPQGKVGGLDIKAQVAGNAKAVRVENLTGKIGSITANGGLALDIAGARPKADVTLALGAVDVTPFLPAKRAAGLFDRRWGLTRAPAAWPGSIGNPMIARAAVSDRWSRQAIDLGALNLADATLAVTSPQISYQGVGLEKADFAAKLVGGVLSVERLTGRLFGGALDASATATADGRVRAAGTLAGADLQKAGPAFGMGKAAGRIDAGFDLNTVGRSEAELVSSLGGTLNLVGRGLDAEAFSGAADAGLGVGGLVLALNQLGGALGGPKRGSGLADVDAAFTVANGVATATQLKAITNVGVAGGNGTVDLPAWTIDMKGAIQPAPNLLSAALSIATKKGVNVPFTVTGKLDAPRIWIDTASLGSGGIAVPGLDKLMNKKGVGDVLQGILGGGKKAPAEPQPQQQQAPEPAPQEQPRQVKPEDIIRGILGRF